MKIALVAIGNEVLTGKTINTNSSYLAREIEQLGGTITSQHVASDNIDDIATTLRYAFEKADTVITIGGLGPTVDDLTREGVAKYFETELVYDETIYEGICQHFKRMKREIPSNNNRQAYRFKDCKVIENHNGTAPGLLLQQETRTIILLPGPPHELELMYIEAIKPYVLSNLKQRTVRRSYRLCGIGESYAEEIILPLYEKYPQFNIAPYCTLSHVDYIVTTSKTYEAHFSDFEADFKSLLGEHLIGSQDVSLSEVLLQTLEAKNLTVATAESCSGGLLSSSFTSVPGSSRVFLEGVVTYSYESKVKTLGIDEARLKEFGAVSKEIASDMTAQLRTLTSCDVAIATTGIAGPSGGSYDKPVGLVYIAVNVLGDISVNSYIFNGNREKIRQQTVAKAQYMLLQIIKAL